ncbi:MAG: calcium-activated chloride channel-domain-containing protein [Benjaminiella poitrasii]|nr:MAG: calcium-activated chloride channel-domain-containing protein [Benjaminiella poitrasii]
MAQEKRKSVIPSTEEFSHLFPQPIDDHVGATPTIQPNSTSTLTAEPALQQQVPSVSVSEKTLPSFEDNSKLSYNAGVDYIIVFRFPTNITTPKGKSNNSSNNLLTTTRAELEAQVTKSLENITARLTKVNLRFQVIPGKEKGTLLIFINAPISPLKKVYRQERVRDFLLGVRVDDIEKESDAIDRTFQDLTEAERLRLIHEILTLPESEGGAGISPLVDKYVETIMPLHNDDYNNTWLKSWSTKWFINDADLLKIRNHFGEKIAYYFAFLQNYFLWLSIPAVMGVLVYFTHSNTLSVWFSIFMLIWSIVFLEMWKRRESELAIQWEVRNYSKHEKRRAEFKGEKMIRDHVTGEETPYVSAWKLLGRRVSSLPGVAIGAVLLSIIVGFVFILQLFLHEYYNGPFRQFLHYAPTVGYVLFIPTMTNIYSKWVKVLTDWELHRTDASWEHSYTQKIFIANFLVGYLSLFITAWIYIPFGDHVLPYLVELNISHEHQTVDFRRLRAQLVYFIVTGQLVGFLTEMVVPYALKRIMPKIDKLKSKYISKSSSTAPSVQQEFTTTNISTTSSEQTKFMDKVYKEVAMEEYNIYTDYVEMVIQFGYVSMFSTVWPLTALCSMINNWIELRGDAIKICKYTRRPIPHRVESIGPWLRNMETLIWLSSITMGSFAYLFHPSTNIHSTYTPVFTLLAILLSEHLYVALRTGIRQAFKLTPSWSEWLVRKEEYKLKQVWLERMVGNHQQFIQRSTIEESNDLQDPLSSKIWNQHLDSQTETKDAIQLKSADLYAKANDAFFDDDYDEALNLFTELINLEPENAEFILKRCQVHQKINHLECALEDAERALKLLKQGSRSLLAKAHLQTGITLHRLGRFHEAQTHLEQSKELNPNEKTLVTWLRKNTEKLPVKVEEEKKTETVPVPATPVKPSARHEWFQNDSYVTIEVFVKQIKPEDITLNFFEDSLSLTIKLPNGSDYSLELEPLAHNIIPKESTYQVLSTKIEIKLKKEMAGLMWGALESEDDQKIQMNTATPSSNKTKDWNKLTQEIEDEKPEGEQALNALFQQIYSDADPDTKRAMMKSFVESNGTCLSTNWEEVGSKKTEVRPPEGMIAKKVK